MTVVRDRDNIEATQWPFFLWGGLSLLWGAIWLFSTLYLKSLLICFIFAYGHVVIPLWLPWSFLCSVPVIIVLLWLFKFLMEHDKDVSIVLFTLSGIVFGLCIAAYYVLSSPLPGPEFISGIWYNFFRIIDSESFNRISFIFSLIPGLLINFFLIKQNMGTLKPANKTLVLYSWAVAMLPGYILCSFWTAPAGLVLTALLANYFTIDSIRKQLIAKQHMEESENSSSN